MGRKNEKHFLELNPEYHLKYYELIRDARIWNSIGQYWLGKECERRANCLLNGNIEGYKEVKHTEALYFKKYII